MPNGKRKEHFVQRDYPILKKHIQTNQEDIEETDIIIADVLTNQSDGGGKRRSQRQAETTGAYKLDDKCNMCGKKCAKDAAECEIGHHWVHYNCDRLKQPEIDKLENSKDPDPYGCKSCQEALDVVAVWQGEHGWTTNPESDLDPVDAPGGSPACAGSVSGSTVAALAPP
jgi:hypothetical protein